MLNNGSGYPKLLEKARLPPTSAHDESRVLHLMRELRALKDALLDAPRNNVFVAHHWGRFQRTTRLTPYAIYAFYALRLTPFTPYACPEKHLPENCRALRLGA